MAKVVFKTGQKQKTASLNKGVSFLFAGTSQQVMIKSQYERIAVELP